MKSFFTQHGYTCVKLFVNQFAISIFGAVLAMATASMGNDVFAICVSAFAILFYVFLVYNIMWEVGAKDRLSFDLGKKEKKLSTGLIIALIANIPNFLIAIIYTVGAPFSATQEWAGNICAIARVLSLFLEGMYTGMITSIYISEAPLMFLWWTYFVIMIPSIAAIWVSYLIGFKNFRFFPNFSMHKK